MLLRIDLKQIVAALKPYGPTPIVATVTGVAALFALAMHADSWAVCVIVFLVIAAQIWDQERRADLRRKMLEVDFDNSLRIRAAQVTDRLESRLEKKRKIKGAPPNGETT